MTDDLYDEEKPRSNPRASELLAIQNVMSTEQGRDFMWRCLQQSCIFVSTFHADSRIHCMNEGRRGQGLWLESELKEASPHDYIKMLKEHIDE